MLAGYPFESEEFTENPEHIRLLRGLNIASGFIHWDDCARWPRSDDPVLTPYLLKRGDVVLAMDGMIAGNLTRVAKVTGLDIPSLLVQRVARLRAREGTDQRFLSYLLRSSEFRDYLWGVQTGTTISHVSGSQIGGFQFKAPTLPEQRAIASVLDSLDDKIELNRRMNQTLEEICRTLFRFWFVNFGPVHEKAESRWKKGESLPGMPADMWDLWPSELEESEIGEIPKGWSIKPLDEVASFRNGLALQRYPPDDDAWLPVLKITQLRAGRTEPDGEKATSKIPEEYVVSDGDVVFSWSGSLEVRIWCGGKAALNQHLFRVQSATYPRWFYYFWVLEHLPEFREIAMGKATTMGHIQRRHLSDALVVIPPLAVLKRGTAAIEPLLERGVLGLVESRGLAATRDTLLPKLLSGEIRVPVDGGA